MEFPMQMTSGMAVAGKLRPHVHRCPAALPVKGAHRHIVSALENILAYRKVPTASHAGNLQIIAARLPQSGEIRGLQLVAGSRVSFGRCQLSLENRRIVIRTAHFKGHCGSADQRNLGTVQRIACLIHFNGQLRSLTPMRKNGNAKQRTCQNGRPQQFPVGVYAFGS